MKLLVSMVLFLSACDSPQWDWDRMIHPAHLRPYAATPFFPDGRAMRPIPPGAVERNAIVDDLGLSTGVRDNRDLTHFPLPLTRAALERGRDRFDIYCAACHGLRGDGDSPVARNMDLRRPPSLIEPSVAAFPPGRVYRVISQGYGLMPNYAAVLPVEDRWAVIGYLKALQLSQSVPLASLPAPVRARALEALQ